jgi:hypothetical protein
VVGSNGTQTFSNEPKVAKSGAPLVSYSAFVFLRAQNDLENPRAV